MQVIALKALLKMIMGAHKALGVLLLMLKIAAVVTMLWLIASDSAASLIWAAGGTFVGLVTGLVIVQAVQKRTGNDGKDQKDA